jgi:hypothetical protein
MALESFKNLLRKGGMRRISSSETRNNKSTQVASQQISISGENEGKNNGNLGCQKQA